MTDRTDVPPLAPAESPQDHPSVIIIAVSHDDGPRVLVDGGGFEQFLTAEQALALASEIEAAAKRLQAL